MKKVMKFPEFAFLSPPLIRIKIYKRLHGCACLCRKNAGLSGIERTEDEC